MRHPNLCKIYEIHASTVAGQTLEFFTMEFLEGPTLFERLRKGPLPRQEADTIARQLCAGLAEAHRNHIIHGDLLQQDYSSADLLTVYLLPIGNGKVTPILEKQLKKGARIVAHDFEFSAWKPEKIVDIDDDGEGRAHRLYLYRR